MKHAFEFFVWLFKPFILGEMQIKLNFANCYANYDPLSITTVTVVISFAFSLRIVNELEKYV